MTELERIEARAKAATKGPWCLSWDATNKTAPATAIVYCHRGENAVTIAHLNTSSFIDQGYGSLQFITEAREDVPRLTAAHRWIEETLGDVLDSNMPDWREQRDAILRGEEP